MRAASVRRLSVLLVATTMVVTAIGAARPATVMADEPDTTRDHRVERVNLRTASSRTYELPDGRMLTQLFSKAVADPYPSSTCENPPNTGAWSASDDQGCVWTLSSLNYLKAVDSTHPQAYWY